MRLARLIEGEIVVEVRRCLAIALPWIPSERGREGRAA